MQKITINCPCCKKGLAIPEGYAGKVCQCPFCNQDIIWDGKFTYKKDDFYQTNYLKAKKLYISENYFEAQKLFRQIEDFSDSRNYIKECEIHITKVKYNTRKWILFGCGILVIFCTITLSIFTLKYFTWQYEKNSSKHTKTRQDVLTETALQKIRNTMTFKKLYLTGEYSEAEKLLHVIDTSETMIKFYIAEIYDKSQKYAEALVWYNDAALLGHSDSQFKLAEYYSNGIGVKKDEEVAFKWYKAAAERGHIKASIKLGSCYILGIGTYENPIKGLAWLKLAAEQGDAEAQYLVAVTFINMVSHAIKNQKQNELNRDNSLLAEAVELLRKAAQQGHADSQWILGISYEHSWLAPQDIDSAIYWYKKAAKQGHEKAQEHLKKLGIKHSF